MEGIDGQADQIAHDRAAFIADDLDTRIGDHLPDLERIDAPLHAWPFRVRTKNVLNRAGIRSWSLLAATTPREIANIEQAGRLTVLDAISGAIGISTSAAPGGGDRTERSTPPSPAPLDVVQRWLATERPGRDLADAVGWVQELSPPPEVTDALVAALSSLAPERIAPTPPEAALTILDTAIGERGSSIFRARTLSDDPPTLSEVGDGLGVTRERVRQLQVKATDRADHLLATSDDPALAGFRWRAHDLRRALGPLGHTEEPATIAALEHALRGGEDDKEATRALMLRVAGPYHSEGNWLVGPTGTVPTLHDVQSAFDEHGTCSADHLAATLEALGLTRRNHPFWLADQPIRRFGELMALWNGSVAAKAISLLAIWGRPATADELNDTIGEGHSLRGLRNQLSPHPQVARASRSEYGLKAWGIDEYSSLAEAIEDALAEGERPVQDVIDELVSRFDAKAASVRLYMDAPAFEIVGSGIRRRQGDPPAPPLDLSRAKRTFSPSPRSAVWSCAVDNDILRGSGRSIPVALGCALGISPGDDLDFIAAEGKIRIKWPMYSPFGPQVGSLRKIAYGLGAGDDDILALHLHRTTMRATAHLLPATWHSAVSPEVALFALLGQSPTADLGERVLRSMSLDRDTTTSGYPAGPDDARAALEARGDHDLARALRPFGSLPLTAAPLEVSGP